MFSFSNKNKNQSPVPSALNRNAMQNPKILEVNLIKDEASVSFDWNKNLLFAALTMLLAVFLVAEVYFGLSWWQAQEEQKAEPLVASVSKLNSEATTLKKQTGPALAFKEKSAAFSELLKTHVYWTSFFTWLEKNTLSSVKYQSFEGGLDGAYSIEAKAKTYADVSWQVKAFLNDPLVKAVEVLEAQSAKAEDKLKANEVNFTVLVTLKPEIFKK